MVRLACMFPGQGSQSMGMLKSLAESDDVIQETFNTAKKVLGIDYWDIIQNGPESAINDTLNTQVLMLISGVALFRYLQKHGMPEVEMMAGHSLGEYTALVCADSIGFEDALRLVQKRAQMMQKAVLDIPGAMAAIIGLSDDTVKAVCEDIVRQHPEMVLAPANFNAHGQVVIAGHQILVQQAVAEFEQKGARMAKIIPVSVPCHCDLMKPAADEFAHELAKITFSKPSCKVVSNVDLSIYDSAEDIRRLLTAQLYQPVLWSKILCLFEEHGIEVCIESGPGKVLAGLAKRTVPNIKNMFCYEPQHLPVWE